MYSYNSYSKCLEVGQVAAGILEEIIAQCKISSVDEVDSKLDFEFITDLLERKYLPFLNELGVSLTFAA